MPKVLPKFDDGKVYALKGKSLNQIMAAIESRTPLSGPGLLTSESDKGVILRLAPESTIGTPWEIRKVDVDGVAVTRVWPSYIEDGNALSRGDIIPLMGGDPIDQSPDFPVLSGFGLVRIKFYVFVAALLVGDDYQIGSAVLDPDQLPEIIMDDPDEPAAPVEGAVNAVTGDVTHGIYYATIGAVENRAGVGWYRARQDIRAPIHVYICIPTLPGDGETPVTQTIRFSWY